MRIIAIVLASIIGHSAQSQANVDEIFDLKGSQKVELSFKWPQVVKVQNWDGNSVKITGSVLINNGQNNDAFRLRAKLIDGALSIQSDIEGIDDLPNRIMIKRDGMTYYFDTDNWDDPEVQKFMNGKGHQANEYVTRGVIKEIELNVFLPKSVEVDISSKYGLVEVNNLKNSVKVNAKYGGVDVAMGNVTSSLEARTRYGEIYSDLPFNLNNNGDFHRYDKWTIVTHKGNSATAIFESKYGNVFLRQKRGG